MPPKEDLIKAIKADYDFYKLSEKIGELQEIECLVNLFESLPDNIKTKIKAKICKN